MARYSLDLTAQEVKDLKRLAKKDDRSMASMMRVVFRRGLRVSNPASDPRQNDAVSALNPQSPDLASPAPVSSTPKKKGEEKEEEGKRARTLAPLDLCERITARMNKAGGGNHKPKTKRTREFIQARLNAGATEDDLNAVIDKMAAEWRGTKYIKYVRPSTLFGPKFDEYLGQPAVSSSGQSALPLTNGYQMQTKEDWEEQVRRDGPRVDRLRRDVEAANRKSVAARKKRK